MKNGTFARLLNECENLRVCLCPDFTGDLKPILYCNANYINSLQPCEDYASPDLYVFRIGVSDEWWGYSGSLFKDKVILSNPDTQIQVSDWEEVCLSDKIIDENIKFESDLELRMSDRSFFLQLEINSNVLGKYHTSVLIVFTTLSKTMQILSDYGLKPTYYFSTLGETYYSRHHYWYAFDEDPRSSLINDIVQNGLRFIFINRRDLPNNLGGKPITKRISFKTGWYRHSRVRMFKVE